MTSLGPVAVPTGSAATHNVALETSAESEAPEEVFGEWDADPFAAASVGQVHRARTKAGDLVAVKVQYPDIDKAIENAKTPGSSTHRC